MEDLLLRRNARLFGIPKSAFLPLNTRACLTAASEKTTDVVQKEMFTFEDKGGRSNHAKARGDRVPSVRAYLENSIYGQGLPFKAYYMIPNFRYEKPQSGRLREHHQFGVECFGSAEPSADAGGHQPCGHLYPRTRIGTSPST